MGGVMRLGDVSNFLLKPFPRAWYVFFKEFGG